MRSSVDRLLDLVGHGYTAEGREPDMGFDCIGLVRYAARECGIMLPEDPHSWRHIGRILDKGEAPKRLDVLCFANANSWGLVDHLGIAVDGRDFIHADRRFASVVCEPIARYKIKAFLRFT